MLSIIHLYNWNHVSWTRTLPQIESLYMSLWNWLWLDISLSELRELVMDCDSWGGKESDTTEGLIWSDQLVSAPWGFSWGSSVEMGISTSKMIHSYGCFGAVGSRISARTVEWEFWLLFMWTPSKAAWASSQHGSWISGVSIRRNQGRNVWYFCGLSSEVTQCHFCCTPIGLGSHEAQPEFWGIQYRFHLFKKMYFETTDKWWPLSFFF